MVAKALDPNADIKTGQWIEGPDGNREVDVEVRGTINGESHFILIECKDWKRPVDIQAIDALDSKRFDLSPNAAIIYSNSGFTKTALRKAKRVGIDAFSAVAEGNKRVRCFLERELAARSLSIDSWNMRIFYSPESAQPNSEQFDARALRYEGLPVVNWLKKLSLELLREYEGKRNVVFTTIFKTDTPFTLDGVLIALRGLRVEMTCSRKWLSQIVREDVSLGNYNHITGRLLIPDQQYWSIGEIKQDAWEETDGEPLYWSKPSEPGDARLNLIFLTPIKSYEGENAPPIDDLINEQSIETSD